MKCLVVADLHYSLPQFDWVVASADLFDLVIMAGDHLDLSSLVDMRAQATVVGKYLDMLRAKTRLIVCSGNHDLDHRDDAGEKAAGWLVLPERSGIVSDGAFVDMGGMRFTICPWWDGPAAQERIGQQLARDAEHGSSRWIWVYHAAPDGAATSWTGKRHLGDAPLRGWIEQYQPDVVIGGHVHQSPFVTGGSWVDRIGKTWVLNAGHQFGAPPAHIALDFATGEVVWMSAAGIQSVRLDGPLERPLARLGRPPAWLMPSDSARGLIPDRMARPAGE
jgi:Icc-related predicted phosphoesterase